MALEQQEIAKIQAMGDQDAWEYVQGEIQRLKGGTWRSKWKLPDYERLATTLVNPQERQLAEMQRAQIQDLLTMDVDEQALADRGEEYRQMMLSDSPLTEDEQAMFEEEFDLQKGILEEQYAIQSEKVGAKQMAEHVSRGTFGTTTGERDVAETQRQFGEGLATGIGELGIAKEAGMSEMESAKREMARQGYALTQQYFQGQTSDALSMMGNAQGYYLGRGADQASTALEGALMTQAMDQRKYQQKMGAWSGLQGLGMKVAGMGLSSMNFGGGTNVMSDANAAIAYDPSPFG